MRLDHPIFRQPLAPRIEWTEIDTPESYRGWPGGRELGARLKVWKVHDGEFPQIDVGLVCDPYGWEDTPDCEWISSGVNSKGPESVALGRVGNFFHWGFFGDPSLMTESAKEVFVNTVCWMSRFDGQRPLQRPKAAQSREWALVYVGYIRELGDRDTTFTSHGPDGEKKQTAQEFLRGLFPAQVLEAAGQGEGKLDAGRIEKYYLDHFEWLIPGTQSFVVDEDARALAPSNRRREFLDALAQRLEAAPGDELAARCVKRYLELPPACGDVAAWLRQHRDRLYFTDVGGFKWRLPPDDLVPRTGRAPLPPEPTAANPVVATAAVEPARVAASDTFALVVRVRTAPTWHIYAHDAEGTPVAATRLALDLPAGIESAGEWIHPTARADGTSGAAILAGDFEFRLPLRAAAGAVAGKRTLRCTLSYQCCDPFRCRPPESLDVECELSIVRD